MCHLKKLLPICVASLALLIPGVIAAQQLTADKANLKSYRLPKLKVGPRDWPQWGDTSIRNNTPFGKNIKWSAKLGSQSWPGPIVANGRVFIGSNNSRGHIKRFSRNVDLACLLCFDEETGKFLWQHSNRKLPTGRVHDWPFQGIVATPVVDGGRLWYVTNRGEVVCLDTAGFADGKNNGPFREEEVVADNEADVIWKFDMMAKLGVRQHNMCTCSLTCAGELLFVVTSNGVDESHINIPAPEAPAFVVLNRDSGKVLWTANPVGKNILHGSWSSPTYAVLGGQPQVLFPGGDGWLYSYNSRGDGKGQAKLLWKFDCNPKQSKWILGGRGTRNGYITMPVVYGNKVYLATGEDLDNGEGEGHL